MSSIYLLIKRCAIIVLIVLLCSCKQDYKRAVSHQEIPCSDGACHKQERDKVRPDRCLACHPEIIRAQKAKIGLHVQPEVINEPSCAERGQCHYEHRTGVLLPEGWQDQLRVAGVHARVSGFDLVGAHAKTDCGQCHKGQDRRRISCLNASSACVSCHATNSPHGAVRVANLDCQRCHTVTGWKPQLQFDHREETQFPLEGKHQEVPCIRCHKERKFRIPIKQYADCAPCHQSKHGSTFGKEECQTCHTAAARNFMTIIPFAHDRTRFPLTGAHDFARMKDKCQTCHKPEADGVPRMECSSCHRNPHQTRFNQLQCIACHVGTTWSESALNHGKWTRFPLTANHVAAKLKDCRSCHRGQSPSDFEDLRGLVTGSGPAKSFPVNCLGCHAHAKAHNRQFTSRQCLDCHERPGKVQPKACRGPNGDRDEVCLNKMAWFGHGTGKPFQLSGGHDLGRIKDKCQTCHRNRDADQAFVKVSMDCANCHGDKDRHRGVLGQQCERCHDSHTGTWKNTARFNHGLRFPLVGAHKRPTACRKCHKGDSLATAFKPLSTNRNCGDAECHKGKVKYSKHGDKYGDYCGDRAGCHSPLHGRFLDPEKLEGMNP